MKGKSILPSLYSNEIPEGSLDLNTIVTVEETGPSQEAKESVARKLKQATLPQANIKTMGGTAPKPLTPEEADAVDEKIEELLQRIGVARTKLATAREIISREASPKGGKEISFKMNIDGKRTLKKAIQKVFGFKTDTITYSMYLECVDALKELQKSEARDYVQKFPEKDDNVRKEKE